jgi:hypothetical protein
MKPLCALLLLAIASCAQTPSSQAVAPGTPGYTGRTVVIGNNSTVAGNAEATYLQQKWGYGPRL